MTQHLAETETEICGLEGRIKWFDSAKGYGFVVADDGGPDILLHSNVLRAFGQSSAPDGARISLIVQRTDRGVQAVEILNMTAPATAGAFTLADLTATDPETLASLPMMPARIKWFDRNKGFGFANVFGVSDDIFVHVEILRAAGLAELAPGEAVVLRVIDGRRGRMAAQLLAWDEATKV